MRALPLLLLACLAGCMARPAAQPPPARPLASQFPAPPGPAIRDDLPEPVKDGYRRARAVQDAEARSVEQHVAACDDRLARVEAGRVDAELRRDVVYHAGTWAYRTADLKAAAVAAARDEARLARARLDRLRDPLAVDIPDLTADAARVGSFGTLTGTIRRVDPGGRLVLDATFPSAGGTGGAAAADDPGYRRQDVVLVGLDVEGKAAGEFVIVPVLLESTAEDGGRTLLQGRAFPVEQMLGK